MKGTQILMHGNDNVATCTFDSRGYLKSVSKIHNEKLLPLCVGKDNPMHDLQRWILDRGLATNRRDIVPFREFYYSSAFQTDTAISLFDNYWFANDEYKDWEKINPYDNWHHETDSVFIMFNYPDELREIDRNSPNLTIPGKEQRLWYKESGNLFLLCGDAQQEMADYKLANGNPVVLPREYFIVADHIYVKIPAETSKSVERICLQDMYNLCQNPDATKMQNLQSCCEHFGISKWKDFFMAMCEYDETVGNTTRELSDIWVLRNSKTLETIGFAKF